MRAPKILCAGIIVLDEVFRVERFPEPGEKAHAHGFFTVNGGCAANAAVAIARLGGCAALAGPLGADSNGDQVLAALAREQVDCRGCQRLADTPTALSAIFIDARGERTIATHRDARLAAAVPADPGALLADVDAVLVDNRFPEFVRPICHAARSRDLTVVLDADRPTAMSDDLFRIATHVVFSSECLRATTGLDELAAALADIADVTASFVAVTDGARDVLWRDGGTLCRTPVFPVDAVDTLAAGDVFHGAFTLALAEGRQIAPAIRFAAAAGSLKCTRLGGSAAAPYRPEVETLLATEQPASAYPRQGGEISSAHARESGHPVP